MSNTLEASPRDHQSKLREESMSEKSSESPPPSPLPSFSQSNSVTTASFPSSISQSQSQSTTTTHSSDPFSDHVPVPRESVHSYSHHSLPHSSHPPVSKLEVDTSAGPPPLNYTLHTPARERSIFIWFSLIFLEACILPLILFYSLRWGAHLSLTKNLAIITSLIGTVSGLKVAQRSWALWMRQGHESVRPIGAGRWGVDFFHILISLALTAFFTPLIIGSSLTPASVPIVAMAIPLFMLTVCVPMTISGLFPRTFRLPIRISSFPPYHLLPPLTYTIVEDVVAVDGGGRLEFRQAWRRRYEESLVMRKLLRDLALFWGISGDIVAGGFIALAWTVNDDIGYGISYGLPWLWAIVCALVTIWWARKELEREGREWGDREHVHKEKALNLVETQLDRDVYTMVLQRDRTISRARSEGGPLRRHGEMGKMRASADGGVGRRLDGLGQVKMTRCTSV